jgi:hypothetical protein
METLYYNPVTDINANNQFGNTSRVTIENVELYDTDSEDYLTLFTLKRYICHGEGVYPTSRISIQVLISEDANPSNTTLIPFEGAGEMFGLVELLPPGWSLEASNTFVVMYNLENLEQPFQLAVSDASEERVNQAGYFFFVDFDNNAYYWHYYNWVGSIWETRIALNYETRKWEILFTEDVDNVSTTTVIDTSEEVYTEEEYLDNPDLNGILFANQIKQPWRVTWDNNSVVEIPQNVRNVTENRDFLPYAFEDETGTERFTRLKFLGY